MLTRTTHFQLTGICLLFLLTLYIFLVMYWKKIKSTVSELTRRKMKTGSSLNLFKSNGASQQYNPNTNLMGCNRVLCISALLFVICDILCLSHAFDTISRTHFITDSENGSLVSSDGNFKLGFFSPGKSQARYVGIWLNKISQQIVVWVANRASPIMNCGGVFRIGGDGNLAVFCGNQSSPVWSTNVSVPASTSSTARLLDSGNLVLVAEETIIWQSFDYPTDTILPGMMYGLNRKTGLIHMLTSWKSVDDPTPGEFSARFDPNGLPQIFLYKSSIPYWRCGPWNGRNMNGLPDIATRLRGHNVDYSGQSDLVLYTVVNNENGSYYTFSSNNGKLFSLIVLEPSGTVKRLMWIDNHKLANFWMAPQDLCDEYDRCGANGICSDENVVHCACLPGFQPSYSQDFFPNCVETRRMDGCGKGNGEGFVRMEAVKLPDTRNSTLYSDMNLKECERECLKSCNCTGYAILDVTGSGRGCVMWYGELRDMRPYQYGQDFYLRVDAVEQAAAADARKKSKHFAAKISTTGFLIVPVLVEMLLAALCFYYLWRRQVKRKGKKQKKQHGQSLFLDSERSLSNHKDSPSSSGQSEDIEMMFFELSTVIAATDHFSSSKKLGQGGFGTVYKGQLSNGQEIAVKRLSKDSTQGILEFKNEVSLIAKLQHRNLVKLLGCCIEKDEKILIYEFMPNGSLNNFIFDESRKFLLDWKTRFDIISGIARGILYLHQDSRLRIIHRDLKVSNILLDEEMTPKISDFGIARIFGRDQTQGTTKRVIGTYGYMSPEYALYGFFSTKSDVFSFGVILLEIISGKKNRGFSIDDPYSNLIQHTWGLWREEKALQIVDSSIADSCPANEVLRCIHVGLLCVQDNARDRPSMSTVVFMLSNETTLPSPKKSTFAVRKSELNSSSTGTKYSINEVTITTCNVR